MQKTTKNYIIIGAVVLAAVIATILYFVFDGSKPAPVIFGRSRKWRHN